MSHSFSPSSHNISLYFASATHSHTHAHTHAHTHTQSFSLSLISHLIHSYTHNLIRSISSRLSFLSFLSFLSPSLSHLFLISFSSSLPLPLLLTLAFPSVSISPFSPFSPSFPSLSLFQSLYIPYAVTLSPTNVNDALITRLRLLFWGVDDVKDDIYTGM